MSLYDDLKILNKALKKCNLNENYDVTKPKSRYLA
jgi:hypothetical protein